MSNHTLQIKRGVILALMVTLTLSQDNSSTIVLEEASGVSVPDKIDLPTTSSEAIQIKPIVANFNGSGVEPVDDGTSGETDNTQVAIEATSPSPISVSITPSSTGNNVDQNVTNLISNTHSNTDSETTTAVEKNQQSSFGSSQNVILDETMLSSDQIHNGALNAEMVSQRTQPEFFTSTGFSYDSFREMWPDNLVEFVEFVSEQPLVGRFKSDPPKYIRKFIVSGTETGEWCFLTLTDVTAKDYEIKQYRFFFDHASTIGYPENGQTIWFREVDDECPSLRTTPPSPPTIKKCNLFYKRTEADYSFAVDLLGAKAGSDVIKCICEATLMLQNQPNIELMCSFEAVTDNAWKILSQEDLDGFDADLKKHSNGKYLINDQGQLLLRAAQQITKTITSQNGLVSNDQGGDSQNETQTAILGANNIGSTTDGNLD